MHIRDRVLSRLFTDGPCVGHGSPSGASDTCCNWECWKLVSRRSLVAFQDRPEDSGPGLVSQ